MLALLGIDFVVHEFCEIMRYSFVQIQLYTARVICWVICGVRASFNSLCFRRAIVLASCHSLQSIIHLSLELIAPCGG